VKFFLTFPRPDKSGRGLAPLAERLIAHHNDQELEVATPKEFVRQRRRPIIVCMKPVAIRTIQYAFAGLQPIWFKTWPQELLSLTSSSMRQGHPQLFHMPLQLQILAAEVAV
jgi:hypothetical protein